MAYIISLIVFIAVCLFGILPNAGLKGLTLMFNAPSFFIVVVPALALAILSDSLKGVNPFGVLFSGRENVDREKAIHAYGFFRTFGNVAVVMGFIGFFISFILVLTNLANPPAVGGPMAMGIHSLLYGLFLKIIFFTAEQQIAQKADIRGNQLNLKFADWSVYLFAALPMLYILILMDLVSK